jgi:putative SOS response-associated peptidase YedK
VLTVPANDWVKPLHDRMPTILSEGQFGAWLDPRESRVEKFLPLLASYLAERMEMWPVSG